MAAMEPRFLPGVQGPLFTVYHPPAVNPTKGGILFVPPFAEELNKSRRMVSLQARRLADQGYAVLLLDHFGCGDSGGDFRQARWDHWLTDLEMAQDWLSQRLEGPPVIWGLRLGALLAAELSWRNKTSHRLLFWQPVVDGSRFLQQFLRLRLATGLMKGKAESVSQLREALEAGQILEVAGYDLHPELAKAVAGTRLQRPPPGSRVDWLELSGHPERRLPPTSALVVESWRECDITLRTQVLAGEPFWTTQEIATVPALLEATCCCLEADSD